MVENRISHFDWIRGCMILWMLVYHISLNYGQIKFGVAEDMSPSAFTLMSFFMAPFYVISGYFFSNNYDWKSFVKNKVRKLFIPYCTFTILGIIIFESYCLITNGHLGSLQFREAIPTGGFRANTPLWFFVSLFFCNVIYYCLTKLGGGFTHFIILTCLVLAFITHNKPQILGYGNILLGITFLHIGYYMNKYKDIINIPYLTFFALTIYLSIAIIAPQRLEFVRNILVQGNYILNYIFTISACLFIWGISQTWKHNNVIGRYLIYLGRNSLVIFAFHRPVLNWIIEPIIRFLYPHITYFQFLIICLICLILSYLLLNKLLNKYIPILVAAK